MHKLCFIKNPARYAASWHGLVAKDNAIIYRAAHLEVRRPKAAKEQQYNVGERVHNHALEYGKKWMRAVRVAVANPKVEKGKPILT